MSQTLDANILVYASNDGAPEAARARLLLEHLATGPELVILLWPTVMAYLRIATHPQVFARPLPHDTAWANVEAFVDRPHVRIVGATDRFRQAYGTVAADVRPRGNDVPDAEIVALMLDHGIDTIWTRDRGFRRYDGVTALDPFADRYAAGFPALRRRTARARRR